MAKKYPAGKKTIHQLGKPRPPKIERKRGNFGMTWKNIERKIAKFFRTERTPLSGGNSKITRSDTLHPELFVEVKYRKKHSVISLWDDTLEMAKVEDKIPVVALAEKGRTGWWLMVHSSHIIPVSNLIDDGHRQDNDSAEHEYEAPKKDVDTDESINQSGGDHE